jgi:hypothetical protein
MTRNGSISQAKPVSMAILWKQHCWYSHTNLVFYRPNYNNSGVGAIRYRLTQVPA